MTAHTKMDPSLLACALRPTMGELTASRPPGASQDAKRRSAVGTLGM